MTITANIHVSNPADTMGTTMPVVVSDEALEAVRYVYSAQFKNNDIDAMKLLAAAFITVCDRQRHRGIPQVARAASVAITAAEDAAMWGVKAATHGM